MDPGDRKQNRELPIFATSEATYAISPIDAIGARENLSETLKNVGLTPKEKFSIRVINSAHSPLKDASVKLTLVLENHGSYTVEGNTDKHGEANFTVPEAEQASVSVEKDGFKTNGNEKIPISTPPYEHTLTLELEGTSAGNAVSAQTSDMTSNSRRNALTLGATVIGGVALGKFLFGSSSPDESGQTDPDRGTEKASMEESIPTLAEDWNLDTGTGAAIQSIESTDDHIYISTNVGSVTAVSFDGTEQWNADLQAESTEPLIILQDKVIVTANSKIRAIDIDTGDTLWEFSDIPSNEEPMVAADERSVTFIDEISDNYVMISIDPSTGEEIWRRDMEENSSRPTLTNRAILSPIEGILRVYNREGKRTGSIEYPTDLEHRESDSPGHLNIKNNRGYLTAVTYRYGVNNRNDIRIHAFDIDAETHLWREEVSGVGDSNELAPPNLTGDFLLYSFEHYVSRVDNSGVRQWESRIDGSVTSMPVFENDTVYVGISQNEGYLIQGLDAAGGKTTSETSLEQSPVNYSIADSSLLVGTDGGEIKKFDTSL